MIRTLVAAELRHHLRDRVTVLALVLGQGLIFPLMGVAMTRVQHVAQERADAVDVTIAVGGDAARLTPYLDAHTRLVAKGSGADATLVLSPPDAPFEAKIHYSPKRPNGMSARTRADALAHAAGAAEADARFRAAGATAPSSALASTDTDTVPAAARNLRRVASGLPALLLLLVASGGLYTALDVVTGEKERGTIETLLSTAADRAQIASAKFLVVLIMMLATATVSLTSLFVTTRLSLANDLVDGSSIPASAFVAALVLFLPLAATLASALVATATWVPDMKSGQVYAFPTLIGPAALAAVALLPDATLTPIVALIPITNLSVALKEILLGTVRPGPLLLCLASSTAYAAASLIAATRWLGREDVLLGDRGGRHRRLRGDFLPDALLVFVVGMALLWFVAAPAQIASFTWGLGVTQFGLFAPLALLTPFLLGLGVRDTLGVRAPALGDLARGALLGALCPCIGFTVAEAQATFIPTSPAVNEMLQGMIPADLPFLVLFGLVAIAPGLCEELLFRGAILGLLDRSLRGRAGPILRHAQAIAIVVTAIAFGLFHTSLFRILPTAALGVVFGTARLRSRSIAVPMIAHMVNNGLLVGAGAAGVALGFQPALLLGFPAIAVLLWGMGRARGSAAPGVG